MTLCLFVPPAALLLPWRKKIKKKYAVALYNAITAYINFIIVQLHYFDYS